MTKFTFQNIEGHCDYYDLYQAMAEQLSDGDRIAELGVLWGRSAAYMCECLKSMNKKVTVYCVDLWDSVGVPQFNEENNEALTRIIGPDYMDRMLKDPNVMYKKFLSNMQLSDNLHYITPIKLPTSEAHNFIQDAELSFCFIDADHTYEGVLADIQNWRKKVKPGGILAGHDFIWDGVNKAVRECFPNAKAIGSCWYVNIE